MKLRFRESKRGVWWVLKKPDVLHKASLEMEGEVWRIREFLRGGEAALGGVLNFEGLASGARYQGTLQNAMRNDRKLLYEFTFTGDDGKKYTAYGEAYMRLTEPLKSLSRAEFVINAGSTKYARATLYFDYKRDGLALAKSLRLAM
ncbi:MAG: hypothetical protein GMKNLPBB_00219 [Myxococcota bacterium]|nr:hypothetical protein [Myxococcota bacterium]